MTPEEPKAKAYARCLPCGYEYASKLGIDLTRACPQCGNTTQTLDPSEDDVVQLRRVPFAEFVATAARFAEALRRADPVNQGQAPGLVKAVARRTLSALPAQGPRGIRVNWGELVLVMRWAEQGAMAEQNPKLFEKVILYARDLERAHPDRRKLTQVTVSAEAEVQERIRQNPLPGIKVTPKAPPAPLPPGIGGPTC